MTEEILMCAYRDGDRGAFEQLFVRLGPRVHGFFMRSFQNRATADDLMQTTFMKLHHARDDYRSQQPLRPWLFSIAARVRIDEFRRRKEKLVDGDAGDDGGMGPLPEQSVDGAAFHKLESAERIARVRDAIARLPESQRVIVHLHRFEELTFGQIAAALGTTEGAVKLRAFRAYERLRKDLGPLTRREDPS